VKIRPEKPADHPAIQRVNDEAFGETIEGELVDAIRRSNRFVPELCSWPCPGVRPSDTSSRAMSTSSRAPDVCSRWVRSLSFRPISGAASGAR